MQPNVNRSAADARKDAIFMAKEPEYQRVTGNDGTITSPFDITILLP
jgi:hypothetical protein